MKFSDGYWMMRAGVHASHPVEVLDATPGDGSLVVYAPTQRIRHRGDLLRGPAVTVSFSAPMPDIIGVEITHFAGGTPREPRFQLSGRENPQAAAWCDSQRAVFTSGALAATVSRGEEWSVGFTAGSEPLLESIAVKEFTQGPGCTISRLRLVNRIASFLVGIPD